MAVERHPVLSSSRQWPSRINRKSIFLKYAHLATLLLFIRCLPFRFVKLYFMHSFYICKRHEKHFEWAIQSAATQLIWLYLGIVRGECSSEWCVCGNGGNVFSSHEKSFYSEYDYIQLDALCNCAQRTAPPLRAANNIFFLAEIRISTNTSVAHSNIPLILYINRKFMHALFIIYCAMVVGAWLESQSLIFWLTDVNSDTQFSASFQKQYRFK